MASFFSANLLNGVALECQLSSHSISLLIYANGFQYSAQYSHTDLEGPIKIYGSLLEIFQFFQAEPSTTLAFENQAFVFYDVIAKKKKRFQFPLQKLESSNKIKQKRLIQELKALIQENSQQIKNLSLNQIQNGKEQENQLNIELKNLESTIMENKIKQQGLKTEKMKRANWLRQIEDHTEEIKTERLSISNKNEERRKSLAKE